jgi:hypothetical protein
VAFDAVAHVLGPLLRISVHRERRFRFNVNSDFERL